MINEINNWLKTQEKTPKGDPMFRIVWADKELEWQMIDGKEQLVKKYSYISPNRFIMEIWVPPALCADLPNAREGSYEPLYVFEDGQGGSLPLARRPVEFILAHLRRQTRETLEEKMTQLEQADQKEIDQYIDSLDCSPIQNALAMGEAVGYGKNKGTKFHG